MLRQHSELTSQSQALRRRQQSQNSEAGPSNSASRSAFLHSGCPNQMLDLSVCHPSQPFSNRFSVLATPPPAFTKPSTYLRDFPATNSRRTRNSRGTKEAKRRRDMRRNRRKLATQLLDQQLSQAVDETLTKANILPPPPPPRACLLPAVPVHTPVSPTATSFPGDTTHQSSCVPTKSPELPLLRFTEFDVSQVPHISTPPLEIPTPFRTLPKWCPKIPSLTLGDVWRDCLPTFFDLSSLPEIKGLEAGAGNAERQNGGCKDMQVWQPIGVGFGREQSRFFPSRQLPAAEEDGSVASSRARVKLPPPVSCKLHASDSGPISLDTPRTAVFISEHQASDPNPPSTALEQAAVATVPAKEVAIDETVAASVWRILSNDSSTNCSTHEPHLPLAATPVASNPVNIAQDCWAQAPSYGDDCPPPYELEGREVALPYAHANALTGFSNGSETTLAPYYYNESRLLSDSGIELPVVRLSEDYNVGLDELVVDHDVFGYTEVEMAAAVPLPTSLPATPPDASPAHSVVDIAAILPIDCISEIEHRNSDAYFRSEQALFLQSPPSHGQDMPTSHKDMGQSSINVADFLKLGHAKQCWCGRCTDEPYYSDTDETQGSHSASNVPTMPGGDDNGSALSLVINPSESEPDCDLEALELPSPVEPPMKLDDKDSEISEDDGWLFFSSGRTQDCPSPETLPYLPSSPILHRQRQRAPTPTIIITTSSDTSSQGRSDEYVTVASPSIASSASSGTRLSWLDRVPRSPSSAWQAGLARYGDDEVECGFAKTLEDSWRWGMEEDEGWWDWAVEDDC